MTIENFKEKLSVKKYVTTESNHCYECGGQGEDGAKGTVLEILKDIGHQK